MFDRVFRDLFDHATDAMWIVDEDMIVRFANPAAAALTGYSEEALTGAPLTKIMPKEIAQHHDRYVHSFLVHGNKSSVLGAVRRFEIVNAAGEIVPVQLKAFELSPVNGRRMFGALMNDQKEIREFEARQQQLLSRLRELALTDELTGLANRRAFLAALDYQLGQIERHAHAVSVAILDVDRFKRVNDTHGHEAGDAVLRQLADIVRDGLREQDTVGRIGGEEFAVLLPFTGERQAGIVLDRVRQRFGASLLQVPNKGALRVTFSVGVAMAKPGQTAADVLAEADTALYAAKRGGRNQVRLASETPSMAAAG